MFSWSLLPNSRTNPVLCRNMGGGKNSSRAVCVCVCKVAKIALLLLTAVISYVQQWVNIQLSTKNGSEGEKQLAR